jgi:hypothetical protein
LSNRAQPGKIDLGVDRGGIETAMSQDIGNLFQGRATLKHVSGRAVAQTMRSMQSASEATSGSRLPDHGSDYTRVNRNIEWRTVPNKHGTALCRRAPLVKIAGNGMSGDGRQRQDIDPAGLSHPHSQCGVLPVNVFQAQRRYLKGAETEIHQAANNRVIALTLWSRLLKGCRQPDEFLLVEVLR